VLEFLDNPDKVTPGDPVRTSGDGGVFPPDLAVGRLIALPGGIWRVALSADYARLEFVRLLRYAPDTGIDRPGGLILSRPRGTDEEAVPTAPLAPAAPGEGG
jgi:rod shape-determining protein MreC